MKILIEEVNLEDSKAEIILDAICIRFGYDPNNEERLTKQEFLQKWITTIVFSEASNHISTVHALEAQNTKIEELNLTLKDQLIFRKDK